MKNFKKAFTLAEILIVLMVIGVIATLTVPSMMKGVQEAQYKASFKKAYNTMSNLYAKLQVEGQQPLPGTPGGLAESQVKFFISMLENLDVRDVTYFQTSDSFRKAADKNATCSVKYNDKSFGIQGSKGKALDLTQNSASSDVMHKWITTEDNISYVLITWTGGNDCKRVGEILANGSNHKKMVQDSCLSLLVDVNGIHKTPNIVEPQYNTLGNEDMQPLSGDMYYIYIGSDGLTVGNKLTHAAARIISDMK